MRARNGKRADGLPFVLLAIGAFATCLLNGNKALALIVCLVVVLFCLIALCVSAVQGRRRLKQHEDYVNAMLHELKTPLASLQLLSEMLADESVKLDTEQRKHNIELIKEEVTRLKQMTERVLGFARAENGRLDVRFEPLDVSKLLSDTAERLSAQAKQKDIKIKFSCDTPNCRILSDKTLLSDVLFNLGENALKYSKCGTQITLGVKPLGDSLVLSVEDQGCGIEKRDLKKIFSKYYRAKQKGESQTPKGFGLGLYFVSEAAKAMKIKIKVESEVGKGSTFALVIPNKSVISNNK